MADVFVSYAHKNADRVAPLSGAIEQSGYSLWWDERLLPSDDYAQVIEHELGAAQCVVVAWSATARESLWVRAEANEALDSGKLVQLTLDGAKLPLPFTILHFLDFRTWRGERGGSPWSDLDGRIGAVLRGEQSGTQVEGREPRLQGLGPAVMLGWAALGLAALMALAIGLTAGGALPAARFGAFALVGLGLATIFLALLAWMMMRTLAASRR